MEALRMICGVIVGVFIGFVFSGLLSSASYDDRCRECLEDRKYMENKDEQTSEEETD